MVRCARSEGRRIRVSAASKRTFVAVADGDFRTTLCAGLEDSAAHRRIAKRNTKLEV